MKTARSAVHALLASRLATAALAAPGGRGLRISVAFPRVPIITEIAFAPT